MVAGRALTRQGRGIAGAMVTMTDSAGATRTVLTNSSGYYRFDNVASGATYIIAARAKRYTFEPSSQVINVAEDLAKVNFTSQ